MGKVYVSVVQSHPQGFGQFQCSGPCEVEGPFDDVAEYAAHVANENSHISHYVVDGDDVDDVDEELALIEAARGAVVGGHDTLVAFSCRDGSIILESVHVQ